MITLFKQPIKKFYIPQNVEEKTQIFHKSVGEQESFFMMWSIKVLGDTCVQMKVF